LLSEFATFEASSVRRQVSVPNNQLMQLMPKKCKSTSWRRDYCEVENRVELTGIHGRRDKNDQETSS